MLVLSRKLNQEIVIGDEIRITVLKVKGNTVRLGIQAPRDVHVVRGELEPKEKPQSKEQEVVGNFTVVFSNDKQAEPQVDVIPFENAKNASSETALEEHLTATESIPSTREPDSISFRNRIPNSLEHNRLKEIVKQITAKK